MIHNRAPTRLHRELLIAFESARTRLAVAIASETKSTPPERLRYYFETADRARRATKILRKGSIDLVQNSQMWSHVLEKLRHAPAQEKAGGLCELLREIIARLE